MMTIGKVHAWPNGCNPGTHVHVEMRNADNKACYIDKGNPGVLVSAGAGIGMLGSSNNVARQACSTSPASSADGSNFNGDVYGDLAVLHERTDGGVDAHILYGSMGTPLQTPDSHVRGLPGSSGWDWDLVRTASGDFNGDGFKDVALVHKNGSGGADVHILYGQANPFQYAETFVRSLPASSGWNWDLMKLEAGKYNGDGYGDLAILHKLPDGGIGVHVLFGSAGTPLQNAGTSMRVMPASSGWNWDLIKTASGGFNGDAYMDIALIHKTASGGADIHVLYGGGTPFQYAETFTRSLPASSGWNWDLMKAEAGNFNGDSFDDLTILHKRTDGGVDAHILYGGSGIPLQTPDTFARSLPGSSGWNWDLIKTASAGFNGDAYADVALIHKTANGGADIHILYGGATPFQHQNTFVRSLPTSSGWNWDWMKIES